jgi:hypothetical protein
MRLGWDQKRLAKWPETYAPKLGQMCKDVIWLPTRDDLVTQMRTVHRCHPKTRWTPCAQVTHAPPGSGLRPPWRGQHELVLLLGNQRPNFGGESHEVGVAIHTSPKRPAIGIVVKLPDVDQLVQGPHIAREVTHQFGRVLGQHRPALVFVKRNKVGHFSDDRGISAQFIDGHDNS